MQEQNDGLLPHNHTKEECWYPSAHRDGCREKQIQVFRDWCINNKDKYRKQSYGFCKNIVAIVPFCTFVGWHSLRPNHAMQDRAKNYMAGDVFAVCPNCHYVTVVWDCPIFGYWHYNECKKCGNKISYADFFQPVCLREDFTY